MNPNQFKVGQTIHINHLNNPDSPIDDSHYDGKEGVITFISRDPWGDIALYGTWGGLSVYPKVDDITIIKQ